MLCNDVYTVLKLYLQLKLLVCADGLHLLAERPMYEG